jgi:hypothetical protein
VACTCSAGLLPASSCEAVIDRGELLLGARLRYGFAHQARL